MIDYNLIAKSRDFHSKNFSPIEVPWTVTRQVSDITKPIGATDFELVHDDSKCLVASGEQGFLYMMIKGQLPPGAYQTVTPCFRKEAQDEYHTKFFVKNELIETDLVTPNTLDWMIEMALKWYKSIIPYEYLTVDSTTEGYDINFRTPEVCVELGSYGIRKHHHLEWVYGTGHAEPRTSNVLKLVK